MVTNKFYIERTSDTSADTLLAVGFASLLGEMHRQLYGSAEGIIICDAGPCYTITLPSPITAEDVPRLKEPLSMVLMLASEKQREKESQKGRQLDGFPYDAQMELSQSYYERRRKLSPELRRKSPAELVEILGDPPDPQLGYYQAISQMKIAGSFNELVQRWLALNEAQQRQHMCLLLDLFGSPENDLAAAIEAWKRLAKAQQIKGNVYATALQIINPTTGKGANYAKASRTGPSNQESFWLLELLKFKGFMQAAAPLVIRESKDREDRKTYVLQPKMIELGTLQHMMRDFRTTFLPSTAIKLDIMASLRFSLVLVTHLETSLKANASLKPWQRQPLISIAQGFEVGSYKDMSNAYAIMNVAAINFPLWLPAIETLEQAEESALLLREHIRLVQSIRTSKGDEGAEEYELLRFYRDFLSGNDLRPFWKFTTAYSGYLVSQREHEKNPKRQIPQITTTMLEVLIKMHDTQHTVKLTEILNNAGFEHIAGAIRQATVNAQYRRAQQGDRRYEVRYGLGQELMRKARYPGEFMIALGEFLHEYNAETAREEEKLATKLKQPLNPKVRQANSLRSNVYTTDLKDIADLIDRFGSELICSMLVAYGYARLPASNKKDDPQLSSTEPDIPAAESVLVEEE